MTYALALWGGTEVGMRPRTALFDIVRRDVTRKGVAGHMAHRVNPASGARLHAEPRFLPDERILNEFNCKPSLKQIALCKRALAPVALDADVALQESYAALVDDPEY